MAAKVIGISGPSCTGKSTLARLLGHHYQDDSRVYVEPDVKDQVWEDLTSVSSFSRFNEVYEDKDYLLLYCGRLLGQFKSILDRADTLPDGHVLIVDFSPEDLVIYMNLHFWYHYPSQEVLTSLVKETLELRERVHFSLLMEADDEKFDPEKNKSLRQRLVDFRRNRFLELSFYKMISYCPKLRPVGTNADEALLRAISLLDKEVM
jgi:adenylate kinase family enzyme